MHKYNKIFCLLLMPALSLTAMAQETEEKKITVSGSIQSDILIPQDDEAIGTEKVNDGL